MHTWKATVAFVRRGAKVDFEPSGPDLAPKDARRDDEIALPFAALFCVAALSAQAFVWLDLLLLSAVFSAERRRDARLTWLPFVLHYLAGLTVSASLVCRLRPWHTGSAMGRISTVSVIDSQVLRVARSWADGIYEGGFQYNLGWRR